MQESGDPELIFFGMEDGTFISASDALRERFSGLIRGEETVFHGCSSTISLRIEVSISYNPCGVLCDWTLCSGLGISLGRIR